MFRYLVLGLLRGGESFHGYALMKAYRQRSGLQLSTGYFYRELQRLVGEGFVRTVSNPADADPRRAPYEITDAGAAAFDAWLAGPTGSGFGRYDDELSARAMLIGTTDPDRAAALIESWKEELWVRSKVQERARRACMTANEGAARNIFNPIQLLIARTLKHIAADLEFLDELGASREASGAGGASRARRQASGAVHDSKPHERDE
jgi:DNA-binding PadR family transcriptional regulator